MISIRQVKAARAMLGWSQEDLASKSGVSYPTIARLESSDGEIGGRVDTADKIVRALESAGVEFTNGRQPGVRMNKLYKFIGEVRAAALLADQGDLMSARHSATLAYDNYRNEIKTFVSTQSDSKERERTLLQELGAALSQENDQQSAAGSNVVEFLKDKVRIDSKTQI